MKKLGIAIAALLISYAGFAQNQNLDYKLALKANCRGTYEYQRYNADLRPGGSLTDKMILPGFGLEWLTKNQNSHEAYVNATYRNYANLTDAKALHQQYSVGYNYFVNFNKSNNSIVVPSVGFGLNFYSESFKAIYFRPGGRTEHEAAGTKAMLTPRMLVFAGDRIFFDVNIPVCLADLSYGDSYSEYSGSINSSQNSFTASAFPVIFSLQVGLGVKL